MKRLGLGNGVLLLLVALLGCDGCPWWRDKGLVLVLRVAPDGSVQVIETRETEAPPAPASVPAPPLLTPTSLSSTVAPGTGELLLVLLDRSNRPVRTFSLPLDRPSQADYVDPDGRLRSGLGALAGTADFRIVHVPLPHRVRGFALVRSVARTSPSGQLELKLDRVVTRTGASVSDAVALPTPSPPPPAPAASPTPAVSPATATDTTASTIDLAGVGTVAVDVVTIAFTRPACTAPCTCKVCGVEAYVNSGPSAERFDIVILGDGFNALAGFQQDFKLRAGVVKDALLATEPFASAHAEGRLNVFRVDLASAAVTVSDCTSANDPKNTCLGTRGRALDADPRVVWFFAIDDICPLLRIIDEKVAPFEQIELVIVIANCSLSGETTGGNAEPASRLFFLPRSENDDLIGRIAGHEAGHVVAGLGEEYIACIAAPPTLPPNVATLATVNAGILPWNSQIQTWERVNNDANGQPRAIDRPANPVPDPYEDMLGAFWGACYTNPPVAATDPCDTSSDFRGYGFFRPMRSCLMRSLDGATPPPFCRVCKKTMRDAIRSTSTTAKAPPWSPPPAVTPACPTCSP